MIQSVAPRSAPDPLGPNVGEYLSYKREKEDGLYLSLSPPVLPISVNIQSTPGL